MKDNLCRSCINAFNIDLRMQIFTILQKKGKQTVSEIVAQFDLKQPTISYHLKKMYELGFLDKERQGKKIYYLAKNACLEKDENCSLKRMNFYAEN